MAVARGAVTIIRAFNGSLADAEGLLAVERAAFNESPYSPADLRAMLTGGSQCGWLAVREGAAIGFAVAFLTAGLGGPCWEIDLLAVHPDWRRRGLATQLIRGAAAGGRGLAGRTRAAVATGNVHSGRAFARAGLRALPGTYRLLVYRDQGPQQRRPYPGDILIEATQDLSVAAGWLTSLPDADLSRQQRPGQEQGELDPPGQAAPNGFTFLLARQNGRPAGYAELIEVQTILYRGIWIERLAASNQAVSAVLIQAAIDRAAAGGLDEVGAMAPAANQALQKALLAAGFSSAGDFHWFTAGLPLPELAEPFSPCHSGR